MYVYFIDTTPTTYDEAVELFKTLPCKAQDDERVISFSIAPLSTFCGTTDKILNDITSENMEAIEKMTLDFDEVKAYFKELKDYEFTKNFLSYLQMILYLESGFNMFKTRIKSKIQKLLPKIRGPEEDGKDPQKNLTDLVNEYETSPFRKNLFFTLLKTRKKEIETAELVIYNKDLKDLKHVYINFDDDANMATCIMNHPFAIEYELQILPEDPQNMVKRWENCHTNNVTNQNFESSTTPSTEAPPTDTPTDDGKECPFDESEKWFMNTEDVGANQPLIQAFKSFAKSSEELGSKLCFLISLRKLKSNTTATNTTSKTHANIRSSPKSTTNTVTNQTFVSSTKPSTEAQTTETPTDTTTDSPTEPPTVLSTEPPVTEPPPIDPTKPPPTELTVNPHFQLQLKKHGQVIIPHFKPPEKLNKWKTFNRAWDSLTIQVDHTKLNLKQYFNYGLITEIEAVVEAFESSVVNIDVELPYISY